MASSTFVEWSGGMQNRTSRFLRKTNEFKLLINGHTDEIGSITKRLGFKKVGGTVETGNTITLVQSAGKYLYAGSNNTADNAGQLKYNDSATSPVGGTWQSVSGGTAPVVDTYFQVAPFAEIKAAIFSGGKVPAAGTVLATTEFSVTRTATYAAPQTTADLASAPKSRWVTRFRDRVYHGYCAPSPSWTGATWYNEASTVVKPNRIVYSNVPSAGTLSYEDQGTSGYLNFYDADGDIQGLGTNNDQFLAWTNQTMWILSGESSLTWKKKYAIGCDSGYTIKNIDIYTFWYNRNGIYTYAGGKPEKISTKIQPVIDAIANPSLCFADSPDDDHYRLWVGTLTLEGLTFKNCVINYTLSTNAFSIYSYTTPTTAGTDTFTAFGSFHDGTKNRMYAGSTQGQVYIFAESADTVTNQVYADGNQTNETYDISFLARTTELDYGKPEERKDSNVVVFYSTNAQGTNIKVRTDSVSSNSEFMKAGQIHDAVEILPVSLASAYWYQYEFTETSQRFPLSLNGMTTQVNQDTQEVR